MNGLSCCGSIWPSVYNAETLYKARRDGLPDDEAYDMAHKGYLCEKCLTWMEENEDGKVFIVHLPSNAKEEF